MGAAPPSHEKEAVVGSKTHEVKRLGLHWLLSLLGAVVFLWIASHYLELWPSALHLPRPWLLVLAIVLQVPYSLLRALRLRFVLDPLVEAASGSKGRRFNPLAIYSTGLVSFLVLLLPFKMGEAWRPLALTAYRQPGVRLTESVGAVAVERLLDALLIVLMLFVGLATSEFAAIDNSAAISAVKLMGAVMGVLVVVAIVVLLWMARDPAGTGALMGRIFGDRLAEWTERLAAIFSFLLDRRMGASFMLCSVAYWVITALQLWLVAHACGLVDFGFAEAITTIAIIGLAIQAPGGPANSGTFQVGMATVLALFAGPGFAAAGSSFAALMYAFSVVGVAVMALVGLVIQCFARDADSMELSPQKSPANEA